MEKLSRGFLREGFRIGGPSFASSSGPLAFSVAAGSVGYGFAATAHAASLPLPDFADVKAIVHGTVVNYKGHPVEANSLAKVFTKRGLTMLLFRNCVIPLNAYLYEVSEARKQDEDLLDLGLEEEGRLPPDPIPHVKRAAGMLTRDVAIHALKCLADNYVLRHCDARVAWKLTKKSADSIKRKVLSYNARVAGQSLATGLGLRWSQALSVGVTTARCNLIYQLSMLTIDVGWSVAQYLSHTFRPRPGPNGQDANLGFKRLGLTLLRQVARCAAALVGSATGAAVMSIVQALVAPQRTFLAMSGIVIGDIAGVVLTQMALMTVLGIRG